MPSPTSLSDIRAEALARRERGDLDSARTLLEGALDAATMTAGEDHPEVLATGHLLANLHRQAGDLPQARRVLENALYAGGHRFGEDHPTMLSMSFDLAEIADELGNRHEARRQYSRVARYGPQVPGFDQQQIQAAQAWLGPDAAPAAPAQRVVSAPPVQSPPVVSAPPVQSPPVAPVIPAPPVHPSQPQHQHTQVMPTIPAPPQHTPVVPSVPAPPQQQHETQVMPAVPAQPQQPPAPEQRPVQQPYQDPSARQPYQHPQPQQPYQNPVQQPYQQGEPSWNSGPVAIPVTTPPQTPVRHLPDAQPQQIPTPTVFAPATAPQQPARRSRGPVIAATAAAIVAVLAAVTTLLLVVLPKDDPQDQVPTTEPKPASDVFVTAEPNGDITISWFDPSDGLAAQLLLGNRPGETPQRMGNPKNGQTEYTVQGLNRNWDYCFTIMSIYSQNDMPRSEEKCTQRGTSPTTTPAPTPSVTG